MLTNFERETIISFNDSEETATIYTCNKALQRKLSKFSAENKGYKLIKSDNDSQTYECPKKLVSFRKPKILNEITREKMSVLAKERFCRSGG